MKPKPPAGVLPTLRVKTLPNDANASGDIFGGWLMSQIDIAGGIAAADLARGAVATVAVSQLQFLKPLFIHDLVSFYAEVSKVGRTSITVEINVYAQRLYDPNDILHIANATYVYVAISEPGMKRELV
jgi:acyl-CoA thioesterase YciA